MAHPVRPSPYGAVRAGSSRCDGRPSAGGGAAGRFGLVRHPLTTRPARRGRRSGVVMTSDASRSSDGPRSADGLRAVLDPADIARALTRIAHEILERNKG